MVEKDGCAAKILLVDDHPAVRQGLEVLLQSLGHQTAGQAESCTEAQALLEHQVFDLAVLDLSLEDGSGLDLLGDLAEHSIPVLIYSMFEDPETIQRALRCGAQGYVTKREPPGVLLEGVAVVLQGKRFVSQRAEEKLAAQPAETDKDPLFLLSGREREIFTAMGRGFSNADMAESLRISPRTVETYLGRMVIKLELENVPALRKFAIASRCEMPWPAP